MTGEGTPAVRFKSFIASLLLLAVVASGVGALAYFGVSWTRDGGRTAAIWLANALLLGALLRARRALRPAIISFSFVAYLIVFASAGDAPLRMASLALANTAEVSLALMAVQRFCGAGVRFEQPRTLLQFSYIAAAAAFLSGAPVAALLGWGSGAATLAIWFNWLAAHTLGLVIGAPLVVIAIDSWQHRFEHQRRSPLQWLLVLALVLGVSVIIFAQSRFPLLFLACPLVIFAAFRTGVAGTAAAVGLISLIAIGATLANSGPIALVEGELGLALLTLQLFLAINFVIGLPVAAILEERDAIRERLAEAAAASKTITDNLREVIFRTDAKGRWVFLNPAWETLTGYSVDAWLGRTSYRLLLQDDFAAAQSEFARLACGETDGASLQQRFRHADGSVKFCDVSIRRLTDASGRFSGTTGNIRDVTAMVAQQDALAASESRFRRIAESAPVGVFRADRDGQLTYINGAWAEKAGMSAEEMLGHGWLDAIADLAAFADSPAWVGFRPGEIRRRAVPFKTANGAPLWMEIVTSAEFDGAGRLQGFIGVAVDVTQQKLANEELARRDEELSLLANNATDAIFRLALDGTCKYASPSAQSLLGVPADVLVGVNLLDRFHPDERSGVLAAFDALGAGETEQQLVAYRSELLTSPGDYMWLEANCGLVRDDAGTPVEIIASIRNISARKALEEELQVARLRAEAAVRARSAFLANMSHEIRTPMNGVIGFAEVLLAGQLSDEQRRQVEMIAESGRTMLRLLNDILDMSKIDAGQMTLSPQAVDVRHVLAGVARMLEPAARDKRLAIEVEVAPDVPAHVWSDPLRLRQIVLNLVSNAVKFTHEGHVRIAARCDDAAYDGRPHLLISVADSGIGIAADRLDAIFAPFAQADDATAQRFGGTGLGLSISQHLAQLMHGEISVTSQPGAGTTFTLALPRVAASLAEDSANIDQAEAPAISPDLRLLVAEDNDINQQLVRDMAAQLGITVTIADNGETAIAMVRDAARSGTPFTMILMDLRMPVMDGIEAARRLRALGYSADELPIVALTANAYREDIDACLAAGMQAHLAKPLRLRELEMMIRRFSHRSALAAPPPQKLGAGQRDAALQARYQERKAETLAALAALARAADVQPGDVAALADALHKLAGTAGSFGEPELGEAAAAAELALRAAAPEALAATLAKAARKLA